MRRLTALGIAPLLLASAAVPPPVATFRNFRYEGRQPAYAHLRAGPGEYLKPILAGSRSDPSIVRVGRDYYLTNTSFGYAPGTPIWHSRDLVHWRLIASAMARPGQMNLSRLDPAWQGNWTNEIRYHDGWFYVSGTCYGCGGLFIARARDVAGRWSNPVFLGVPGRPFLVLREWSCLRRV